MRKKLVLIFFNLANFNSVLNKLLFNRFLKNDVKDIVNVVITKIF